VRNALDGCHSALLNTISHVSKLEES
jgi:hypothetical protein